MNEGDLSRLRANLVNRDTLAALAQGHAFGAAIRLGEGEVKSGGALRPSILADAFEAVIGAIFVDAGFVAAAEAIAGVYAPLIARIDPDDPGKDPKTRLQEWLQARRVAVPDYSVIAVAGEAHAQTFTVECRIAALGVATRGEGNSRRAAEQAAAVAAWAALGAGAPGSQER
jgi:ribonuclease-3